MKRFIRGAILGLLVVFTVAGEREPSRYAAGLSPYLPKRAKDDVFRQVVTLMLEDLPLGSSLQVYDAYHLQSICQVQVPELGAFKSGKTRAAQFRTEIQKLRQFLAATNPPPAGTKLNLEAAVRFPQFLSFLAENFGPAGGGESVVILIGSPLYLDAKEPGFSMVDGYFPSDGHLLASRDQSVFGLKGREGALRNMAVHYGYLGDPWVSEIHREKIQRFWGLYLREQGARLETFCGDLPTLFQKVRQPPGMNLAEKEVLDRSQAKIEMLRITRDTSLADWITTELSPGNPSGPPSKISGPMKIGIRWKGNIDLDLYARPARGAEMLYFEHARSAEGYYFKDHRSSPNREYEFIEFQVPVNVWEVEASINFYEGSLEAPPAGEIRIEFDGKIYSSHFSLGARRGNQGRSGRRQEEFWTRVDIPAILKLRAPGASAALTE